MITCRDARHLFSRYLDGELSPSLQTELHAHRLNCTSCQNELAMAETFGDVIALDRREPVLSSSFTDRVLLARRSRMQPRRKPWGRRLLLVGSPMAAAASIVLAFLTVLPSVPNGNPTIVAGAYEESSVASAQPDASDIGTMTIQEQERLPERPAVGFLEALLAPVVEQSRNTLEATRRGTEELAYLLHLGLTGTNEMLVAEWQTAQQEKTSRDHWQRSKPLLEAPVHPVPEVESPPSEPKLGKILNPL